MIRIRTVLRDLTRRRRFERDMAEEIRLHIEAYADDLAARGTPRGEAERRARLEFGNVDNAREDCREARGLRIVDQLVTDTRYAARVLRKSPGFTVTALATLAICLGANLTIFAVVDAVLLRPLPFPDAHRLVSIYNTYPGAQVFNDGCSVANYYERRGRLDAFEGISIYRESTATIGEPGVTEIEPINHVSADFFATLGTPLALGRAFDESETTYGTNGVTILTDAYWRERFDARPDIIGQTLRFNGTSRTIVGVLPASFRFLSSKARVYVPLPSNADERSIAERHSGTSDMIARLAPGAALDTAQAQVDALNAALAAGDPFAAMMTGVGFRSIAVPLHVDHVAAARSPLLLMQAGALALLLIAAANLVNLLLIRAGGRARELAVRRALGAGRRHVIGEIVVETSLLSLAGGVLGLGAAATGVRMLGWLGTASLPLGAHVALDGRVAAAAVAASLVLGLVMALPIAWYYLRSHTLPALQSESRGSTIGRGAQRMRHAFLVAQIAIALVLVAGAGLLAVSLDRAMAISPGFRAAGVLSARVSLWSPEFQYKQQFTQLAAEMVDRLARQPGVSAAGIATNVPLSGRHNKSAAVPAGLSDASAGRAAGATPRGIYAYGVTGDYFAALGIFLREGRFLTSADSVPAAARVAVVDEAFARRYWPDTTAVGRRVFQGTEQGAPDRAFTIVGVVGAAAQADVTEADHAGAVFYPLAHSFDSQVFIVARTSLPAASLAPALRQIVRGLNQDLPVSDVMTMEERVERSMVGRRSPAAVAVAYAAIAALLAAIGTYGVMSYSVAQRRREIGVRIALGARPGQVRAQFLTVAGRALALGGAIGLAGAWAAGKAMESLLYGVTAVHVPTLAGAALVLALVALPACLLPSHRAARVSPIEVLR